MNKTKKILVTLFILFTASIIGIFVLFYSFNQGMKADPEEEDKIRSTAEQYLKTTFTTEMEIYDVLFDNMGNQANFDYAAKVRDNQSGTEFLVYVNNETGEVEDSFIADKWRDDAELALKPYIEEKLGDVKISRDMRIITKSDDWDEIQKKLGNDNQLVVLFDDQIGKELAIEPNKSVSYKDYDVSPTVRLTIPRKKVNTDDNTFSEIIHSIHTDGVLAHGTFIVEYINTEGVPLEDDEWREIF